MKNVKVSIIIPIHKVRNCFKKCLSFLSNQTYKNFEVILIDDFSIDNSIDMVRKSFPNIKIVNNSERLGAIKSRNIGIKNSNSSYIALLDSDTLVKKEWLEELVKVIQSDKNIGMCAPKILKLSEPEIIDSVGHDLYYDFSPIHRGSREVDIGQLEKSKEVFGMCLAGALFRKEVFDKVGLFDEDYGQNFGDDEWTWRARLAGYRCIYVPTAVMYHKRESSNRLNSQLLFFWERNRIWSMIKYYPLGMIFISIFYTLKRYVVAMFSYLFIKKKENKLSLYVAILTILYAWTQALFKLPLFIKKRRQIQTIQRISNSKMRFWLNKTWSLTQ